MRSSLTLVTLALLALGAAMAWTALAQQKAPAGQDPAAKPFVTSLTIYPVALGGKPNARVGEVVGLLLEKRGFRNIRIAKEAFSPAAGVEKFDDVAAAFGAQVKAQLIKTEFALYAQYLGSRKTGVTGVRGVIVDRAGKVVWRDSQSPSDAAFKRVKPRNPMTCCVLLGQRVLPVLILAPKAERDQPGPMAKLWEVRSAVPPRTEFARIKERAARLAARRGEATVTVYPVRIGKQTDSAAATALAKQLSDQGLLRAQVAATPLALDIKPDSNEQRVLWDMARAFQAQVKKTPPATDYVLFADYLMNPKSGKVGAVHLALCDQAGDWVIVDYQNEYQADFKAVKPASIADCTELAARRVATYMTR